MVKIQNSGNLVVRRQILPLGFRFKVSKIRVLEIRN